LIRVDCGKQPSGPVDVDWFPVKIKTSVGKLIG
jgi:hypothetical protein